MKDIVNQTRLTSFNLNFILTCNIYEFQKLGTLRVPYKFYQTDYCNSPFFKSFFVISKLKHLARNIIEGCIWYHLLL